MSSPTIAALLKHRLAIQQLAQGGPEASCSLRDLAIAIEADALAGGMTPRYLADHPMDAIGDCFLKWYKTRPVPAPRAAIFGAIRTGASFLMKCRLLGRWERGHEVSAASNTVLALYSQTYDRVTLSHALWTPAAKSRFADDLMASGVTHPCAAVGFVVPGDAPDLLGRHAFTIMDVLKERRGVPLYWY